MTTKKKNWDINEYAKDERTKYLELIDIAFGEELDSEKRMVPGAYVKKYFQGEIKKDVDMLEGKIHTKIDDYYACKCSHDFYNFIEADQIKEGKITGFTEVLLTWIGEIHEDEGYKRVYDIVSIKRYLIDKDGNYIFEGWPASLEYNPQEGQLVKFKYRKNGQKPMTLKKASAMIDKRISAIESKMESLQNELDVLMTKQENIIDKGFCSYSQRRKLLYLVETGQVVKVSRKHADRIREDEKKLNFK